MFSDCESLKLCAKHAYVDYNIIVADKMLDMQKTFEYYKEQLLNECSINKAAFDPKEKLWRST